MVGSMVIFGKTWWLISEFLIIQDKIFEKHILRFSSCHLYFFLSHAFLQRTEREEKLERAENLLNYLSFSTQFRD